MSSRLRQTMPTTIMISRILTMSGGRTSMRRLRKARMMMNYSMMRWMRRGRLKSRTKSMTMRRSRILMIRYSLRRRRSTGLRASDTIRTITTTA